MINQIPAGWVAVARDTFKYNMQQWVRVGHEQWLRDSLRSHPVDPRGQVLVPSQMGESFKKRRHFTAATAGELAAAGYPSCHASRFPQPHRASVPGAAYSPSRRRRR